MHPQCIQHSLNRISSNAVVGGVEKTSVKVETVSPVYSTVPLISLMTPVISEDGGERGWSEAGRRLGCEAWAAEGMGIG